MKVMFVEGKSSQSLLPVADQISKIKGRIGLVTTVQHAHKLNEVKEVLGDRAVIGRHGLHCVCDGQVLGCDVGSAASINNRVDCFVYIGTGIFHALPLVVLGRPVYVANPFSGKVAKIGEEDAKRYLAGKAARASKVLSVHRVGILVSIKPGQNKIAQAKSLKRKLEKSGKDVFLFFGDLVIPDELLNFPDIEAWVNTACPRLAEDSFSKPVANIIDM